MPSGCLSLAPTEQQGWPSSLQHYHDEKYLFFVSSDFGRLHTSHEHHHTLGLRYTTQWTETTMNKNCLLFLTPNPPL